MSGLIICGFPGVGKSSVGGWNNCVDLESSHFSRGWEGNMIFFPKNGLRMAWASEDESVEVYRCPSWVARYSDVGLDLVKQGYTVLMSTHKDVIEILKAQQYVAEDLMPIVIFCPKSDMRDAWVERLQRRYDDTGSPKDFRALKRVKDYFEQDLVYLEKTGLPIYRPSTMDYDLKTYISLIRDMQQNVKERNGSA